MLDSRRILLVDLNNFARYPSLAVGYLAASLRKAGAQVQVFAPLMVGVQGVQREVTRPAEAPVTPSIGTGLTPSSASGTMASRSRAVR